MQLKGTLIRWDRRNNFGFILPHGGGSDVFIEKQAFSNKSREPQVNDIIAFSVTKDQQDRYCADKAYFTGEEIKTKTNKKYNLFSIYLAVAFLGFLFAVSALDVFSQSLFFFYLAASVSCFIAYATDKSKAKNGSWRIQENTLHFLAVIGGWPGAIFAQQLLRHKSQKKAFRVVFWMTVVVNLIALVSVLMFGGEAFNLK